MISIISAIGKNNEIGKNNGLLWDMPVDLKHFKKITSGHPIIMGQKTFESLGRPLPNRKNLVLTLDENFKAEGVEIFHSLVKINDFIQKSNEEFFVIGGGQIYRLFMSTVDKLYITHVDGDFPDADTYFPTIEEPKWQKIKEEKHEPDEKNKYAYSFVEYAKKLK